MNIRYPTDYCVYDLETTGLDTATCRVVEMAVKRVVGEHSETFSWLVKPDSPLTEDELRVCREVTHIDPAMLEADGVPMEEAIRGFVQAVSGLPLVGHNILRYDNKIMSRILAGERSYVIGAQKFVDTAALFKAQCMQESPLWHESHDQFAMRILETRTPGLKFNLGLACAELGIDVTGIVAHRASGDVEMVDRIYRKMALGL